jgi:hypothetical protein
MTHRAATSTGVRGYIGGKSITDEPLPGTERQIHILVYRFVSLFRSDISKNISHIVGPENRAGSMICTADEATYRSFAKLCGIHSRPISHCGSNHYQVHVEASLM